eukprot:scaffold38549_cov65-Phaeocystis_antarctica.AAC.1
MVYHREEKGDRERREDGGVQQQRAREAAERSARDATLTGDKYDELLADGALYASQQDWRRAGRACREAIALRPDKPTAYFNLGNALNDSGYDVQAAQRYVEAKERYSVGSVYWAQATANAFDLLRLKQCTEAPKPEWWNDEELKALSARVVRAAPNGVTAQVMQAAVLIGGGGAWEAGPRSAADLRKAATHYERAAALCPAPAMKAEFAGCAGACRRQAEAIRPLALVDAVRGLHVADPDLGLKPLLAKLREQQPDLGAATREVREALIALKAESEAAKTAAAGQPADGEGVPPAADEGVPPAADAGGAPPNVA